MKQKIFLILTCLNLISFAQISKKTLFIGNGYTSNHDIPLLVKYLALANDDTLFYDQNTISSYRLSHHCSNYNTINKIKSDDWDYVILQEQSQIPAFPSTQVEALVKPFANLLNDSIKANNSCSKTMFFMTWGRENGDQNNCSNYPLVCTYEGMQQRLRETYLEMTSEYNADCAPVGVAWKKVREAFPNIDLYEQGSLPSIKGSYLAACVLYSSIFHKSSVGNTYWSTLDSLTAYRLQDIASSTVLDSLYTWSIETTNDFVINDVSLYECDSIEVLSNWYYSDTLISDTVADAGLCVNITNYYINIGYQSLDSTISICDSIEINGNWYSSDTIFNDTVQSSPCDLIVIYDIQINDVISEIHSLEQLILLKTNETGIFIEVSTNNYDTVFLYNNDTLVDFSTSNNFMVTYNCFNNSKEALTFTLVAKSECNIDSLTKVFNCNGLSAINEISNSVWQISPNPANNFINIQSESFKQFSVSLLDISGKELIHQQKATNYNTKLDVSIFEKGIYFVVIYDNNMMPIGQERILIH